MSFRQVIRAVVRDPNLSLGVFPNQDLQRQVDRDARGRQHHRRPRLRAAENQQLCGWHLHSYLFRLSAVINESKQNDPCGLQDALQHLDGFIDGVNAGNVDNSIVLDGINSFAP